MCAEAVPYRKIAWEGTRRVLLCNIVCRHTMCRIEKLVYCSCEECDGGSDDDYILFALLGGFSKPEHRIDQNRPNLRKEKKLWSVSHFDPAGVGTLNRVNIKSKAPSALHSLGGPPASKPLSRARFVFLLLEVCLPSYEGGAAFDR